MTITQPKSNPDSKAIATYDVVVVGAGFSGIYQLWRLREHGFSVVLLEASSGLGGVWSLNRYPGARVDSEAAIYQFSDEQLWKDWDYSEMFPGHREMRRYFAYVESKLDISKDCRFNTKVVAADFDESENTWTLTANDGTTTRSRYVLFATGSTVEPYWPDFPGLDKYRGTLVHSARWPEDLDYANKRVAVIGTGASGVQIIQEIGPVAEQLTVFQRTPNLSLPMQQSQLTAADSDRLKESYPEWFANWGNTFAGFQYDFDPRKTTEVSDEEREETYEKLWQAGGFQFWLASFSDYLFDLEANRPAYEFWKRKIRAIVKDPVKKDLLAPHEPPHPFGTKRPCLHQNYYAVMNQDNVEIVSVRQTPIERFTESGIRTADGQERDFDIVVLATGYDNNTGTLTAIDIRSTDGTTLRDKWTDGVDIYLGVMTNGFPNLLFLYGPQSPAAFGNGPASAELQGDEVIELLLFMRRQGRYTRLESTVEADEAWTAEISAVDDMALFKHAESWYNAANIPGKHRQMLQFPGGFPAYLQHWRTERESGYTKGFMLS